MAKQTIFLGNTANDRTGDPLRTAFQKVNENFNELYAAVGADAAANELVNGAHIVSLGADGVLTMPDGLTIDNSAIGYTTSDTITEETVGGTVSQTTSYQNQIIVDTTDAIRIAKIITQTVNDGVVTTTDSTGSTIDVDGTGVSIKKYVEPDGPNNGSYFQISTTNSGAIIEGVNEELPGNTYGRVTVTQGVVAINVAAEGLDKQWSFNSGGEFIVPEAGTIMGTNDLTIESQTAGNSSGLFLNGNTILGTAMLYAHHNAIIRSDNNGDAKDWAFNTQGDLELPTKFPVQFTAVFDEAHYNGGGTFQGDGTASIGVELQGLGAQFQWLVDDPIFETDLGYVGQQAFRYTEADHGITGVNVDILMEMMGTGPYNLQIAFSPAPGPADLAKIRSTDELIISSGTKGWIFDVNGDVYLPAGGDIRDSTGTSVLGGTSYDQSLNTTDNVSFNTVTSELRVNDNIRTSGTADITVAAASDVVIFTAPQWMTGSKLTIVVEGTVDSDGTFTKHTQTCEATVAATYNTSAEPVISIYGLAYTSVNPLATFDVRRGTGDIIEVLAHNNQGTQTLFVKVHATQFVSHFD